MRRRLSFVLCVFYLNNYVAEAETPFKKICHGQLEIFFFNSTKMFPAAKQACVDYGGHLVKVDSAAVQRAIENALGKPDGRRYFIGGEQEPNGNFIWVADGTKVGGNEYTSWKEDQPNHLNNEDCMGIGDHKQYGWTDVTCTVYGSESRYICQRKTRTTFNLRTSLQDKSFTCQSEISGVQVNWTRKSQQITTASESGVYQVLSADKSVLMLEKANMSHAGTYTCVGEANCFTKQLDVKVTVDGTPTIHKIENSICNGSLFVTWKPDTSAVGFPHRIAVIRDGNSDSFVTPNGNDIYRTEITGLDPDTEYTIQITACLAKQSCSTGYKAEATTKTNGIYGLISSAVLANDDGDGCKASWWPPGEDRIFTLTTSCSIDESRYPCEKEFAYTKANELKTTNYLFQPPPNRKCEVSVQVQECVGVSKAFSAKGFCVTPSKEPLYVGPPIIYGALQGNSNMMMKLSNPSEENGLISCVFLIVCYGDCGQKNFTIDDLKTANKTDIENFSGDEYAIAIAIPMSKLLLPIGPLTSSAHYVELSNGNITQCNVYNTTASNSTDVANGSFHGQNVIVNNSVNVRAFLVTATPSNGVVLLKSSPLVIIRNKTPNATKEIDTENKTKDSSSGSGWIAGLAVGVAIISAIIGAVLFVAAIKFKQRRAQAKDQRKPERNTTDDSRPIGPSVAEQEYPSPRRPNYENYPETPAYEEIGDGDKGSSAYESYNA